MSYPSKPEDQRRKTFGVSFPGDDALRMDALIDYLYPGYGHRKRSEFITSQVYAGLVARWGDRWREIADRLIAERDDTQIVELSDSDLIAMAS